MICGKYKEPNNPILMWKLPEINPDEKDDKEWSVATQSAAASTVYITYSKT